MFRIKICGVTSTEDARAAARAGADAIGLNFYRRSSRFVTMARAREISGAMPAQVVRVGVFVNSTAKDIVQTADAVGLDIIQLHGDEPPTLLTQLGTWPVIRAFRCRDDGLAPVNVYLEDCRAAGCLPHAVLLDAYAPGKYGGTGKCLDWATVRSARGKVAGIPLILAGGLTPENVGEAITTSRPAAVDTAGGVEVSPGRKDADKMAGFVSAAITAFERNSADSCD